MFHPRLHNINYLHVIKSYLIKIKSSQVLFSIRFLICCSTLLKRKQLFAVESPTSHYTSKVPAEKHQRNFSYTS